MTLKHPVTTFYLSPLIKERLEDLCKRYGETQSAVIRRLISDAYLKENHVSQIRGCYMPESQL